MFAFSSEVSKIAMSYFTLLWNVKPLNKIFHFHDVPASNSSCMNMLNTAKGSFTLLGNEKPLHKFIHFLHKIWQ